MENLTNKITFTVFNTKSNYGEGYTNFRIDWQTQKNPIYYGRVYFLKGEQQKEVYVKNIIETCRNTQFLVDGDKLQCTNIYHNYFWCTSLDYSGKAIRSVQRIIDLYELPLNEKVIDEGSELYDFSYAPIEEYIRKTTTQNPMLPCVPATYPAYMSSVDDEGTIYAAKIDSKFYLIGEGQPTNPVNTICERAIGGEVWTFDLVDFNPDFLKQEDWGALIPDGKYGVEYGYAMHKIANVDCNSRYFIQWETRYGGIQCQPFSLNNEYSENIKTTKIANIIDEERPINKQVESNWELNTRYLNDVEIKTFEDLFIAPRVWLIDTEKGMRLPVIVNDNKYVETQFKNGRRLNNLKIKVSANTKQNIIY